jgi:hypothetical protein
VERVDLQQRALAAPGLGARPRQIHHGPARRRRRLPLEGERRDAPHRGPQPLAPEEHHQDQDEAEDQLERRDELDYVAKIGQTSHHGIVLVCRRERPDVSFEEAASVFLDPAALTFLDPDHSGDEERAITVGRSARHRVLFVAHTEREDRLRIISARRATRQGQEQYEEGIDEATP